MNNLKFRAWHKENKRMMYVRGMDAEKGQEMTEFHCFWDLKNDEGEELTFMPSDWFKADELILMQSTGLKDSKGVEIFEGDILKLTYEGEDSFHAVYDGTEDGYPAFDLDPSVDDCNSLSTVFQGGNYDGYIVVGNIYEQPELLEVGYELF